MDAHGDLPAWIIDRCGKLGFAHAGITQAAPSAWADEMRLWLEGGRHGSMTYMTEALTARLDATRFMPGCRSLILVADQYGSRADPPDTPSPGRGRIAKYARGRDYHRFIKRRLHTLCDELRGLRPGGTFRAFVDTAPVLEREHAARAGLGWIGKHTLLIHPRLGSYLVLGGIASTLDLPPGPAQRPIEDACGACTRCIDACPTGAISPYSVDARRCISYLTIEHDAMLDSHLAKSAGDWLYGCDVCQEVCPHNSPRPPGVETGSVHPAYAERRSSLPLLEVLGWDEAARRAAFMNSPMKRATLAMMKRNAIVVAANQLRRCADAPLASRLREISADESEPDLVRSTARTALADFDGGV